MIRYIKILILALITGATSALPASSAAHYAFGNSVLNFTNDNGLLGFYYSVISVVFSVVIFVFLRKIYSTGIKSLFSKEKKMKGYKTLMRNILISLLPVLILFVPVGEGKLLTDLFDGFLAENNLLLIAFASIIGALMLVISIWYSRQNYAKTLRSSDWKASVRMSVYQIVAYVIPGISHVSSGAVNMAVCDVDSRVIIREIYMYIAPQMFLVNIVKIIRFALTDTIINPINLLICIVGAALMCSAVVAMMSKVNIRRLLVFFSIYSAVFGVAVAVLSFILK